MLVHPPPGLRTAVEADELSRVLPFTHAMVAYRRNMSWGQRNMTIRYKPGAPPGAAPSDSYLEMVRNSSKAVLQCE